jgi:uncharacterized spore protein YtfJ
MPNVNELWKGTRDAITVKRVYGDPVESDGVTLIPAAAVRGVAGAAAKGEETEAVEAVSASSRARSAPR